MPYANLSGREIHYSDTPPSASPSAQATSDDGSSTSTSTSKPHTLTLILVHGLGSTQNFYYPILPHLARYRCVTFDNYAAGRSRYYADLYPDTSVGGIAGDVVALMDHLRIERAVVVGYVHSRLYCLSICLIHLLFPFRLILYHCISLHSVSSHPSLISHRISSLVRSSSVLVWLIKE